MKPKFEQTKSVETLLQKENKAPKIHLPCLLFMSSTYSKAHKSHWIWCTKFQIFEVKLSTLSSIYSNRLYSFQQFKLFLLIDYMDVLTLREIEMQPNMQNKEMVVTNSYIYSLLFLLILKFLGLEHQQSLWLVNNVEKSQWLHNDMSSKKTSIITPTQWYVV